MAKVCDTVTVKVIEGKHSDAHIVFEECEEGFHIKLTNHGTDDLKQLKLKLLIMILIYLVLVKDRM